MTESSVSDNKENRQDKLRNWKERITKIRIIKCQIEAKCRKTFHGIVLIGVKWLLYNISKVKAQLTLSNWMILNLFIQFLEFMSNNLRCNRCNITKKSHCNLQSNVTDKAMNANHTSQYKIYNKFLNRFLFGEWHFCICHGCFRSMKIVCISWSQNCAIQGNEHHHHFDVKAPYNFIDLFWTDLIVFIAFSAVRMNVTSTKINQRMKHTSSFGDRSVS